MNMMKHSFMTLLIAFTESELRVSIFTKGGLMQIRGPLKFWRSEKGGPEKNPSEKGVPEKFCGPKGGPENL